jgi:hypothetical protein
MYHIFIKYALQLLIEQRQQDTVLTDTAAALKNKEVDSEQELRRTKMHLQKRLMETIPQETLLKKATSIEANREMVSHSEEVVKKMAQELSKKLEKEVLS